MHFQEHRKTPVGIDFGTTYSSIAYAVKDGKGNVYPNAAVKEGLLPKIPTAVFFMEGGDILIGEEALEEGSQKPERLYTNFKSKCNLDPLETHLRPLPDDQEVSANDLAKKVIRKLLDDVESEGDEITKLVVCHPAGEDWRRIINKIMNELDVEAVLLSEPEAALYYAQYKYQLFDERNETVLLIDFGGGTCDFIITKVKLGFFSRKLFKPELNIIDEDRLNFGGKDIDFIIRNELVKRWKNQHKGIAEKIDEKDLEHPQYNWGLLKKAKEVKEKLSNKYWKSDRNYADSVIIPGLPGNSVLKTTFTLKEFCDLIYTEIDRRFKRLLIEERDSLKPFLGRKEVYPGDITKIILTGGSSKLPLILDKILPSIFPALSIRKNIYLMSEPGLSVAYGAAIYAYDIDRNRPQMPRYLLEDLLIELSDGNIISLVKRPVKLPLDEKSWKGFKVFPFPSTGDELEITLYAGENHRADEPKRRLFQKKTAVFDKRIKEGTKMAMRIGINIKGKVYLYISPVGFLKKQPTLLVFDTLNTKDL